MKDLQERSWWPVAAKVSAGLLLLAFNGLLGALAYTAQARVKEAVQEHTKPLVSRVEKMDREWTIDSYKIREIQKSVIAIQDTVRVERELHDKRYQEIISSLHRLELLMQRRNTTDQ